MRSSSCVLVLLIVVTTTIPTRPWASAKSPITAGLSNLEAASSRSLASTSVSFNLISCSFHRAMSLPVAVFARLLFQGLFLFSWFMLVVF